MTLNVAIIGPDRSKQGTGPYITSKFHQYGANISALVSSSLASAKSSAKKLNNESNIKSQAYATLEEAIERNKIDIVVISTPVQFHYQYLKTAINAGCHIFCEKPLWWPTLDELEESDFRQIETKTIELLQLCHLHKVIIQLNTQWPLTLPTFYEIYPQHHATEQSINTFSMWLSPQSTDSSMIIDSVPHLLSMLYAIAGSGRIQNIDSNYALNRTTKELKIEFEYLYTIGSIYVDLTLTPTDSIPKSAAYSLNGNRVDRHVELENYLISLQSSDKQLPIVDPLDCSIRNFLSTIYSKTSSDDAAIIDGMIHLAQIYKAIVSR